jgi:hypothetical protein
MSNQASNQASNEASNEASDVDTIFRQEALEFRARGRDAPGGVVRLGARWIRWAYRATLIVLAVAITGTFVIRTDESATGPAVVDGRTGAVAALLPIVVGPDLTGSTVITITLPGGRPDRITGLHAQVASQTSAAKAGLAPLSQPGILITGRLAPGTPASRTARLRTTRLRTAASVVLRSESLADVLARQFNAMLGSGTTP